MKERNQARKEKQQKVQREKMMRKDAELMARKKIQEEEKARKLKIQNEEAAIQQEMARLRKEMEAEKLKVKEEEERYFVFIDSKILFTLFTLQVESEGVTIIEFWNGRSGNLGKGICQVDFSMHP